MTVKEIQEHILRLSSPANPQQPVLASAINAYLFDAMCDAAQKSKMYRLRSSALINVDSSNAFYFPVDMLQLLEVGLLQGSPSTYYAPLVRITQEKADAYLSQGIVSSAAFASSPFYCPTGIETTLGANYGKEKFSLYPAPTSSLTNGLQVRYLRYPTAPLTVGLTNELVDFPKTFHLALAYRAAWLLLSAQSARNSKDFAGYHQFYQEQLKTLQENYDEDSMFDSHGGYIGVTWGGIVDQAQQRLP